MVRSGANPIGEPGGVLFRRDDYLAVGGWNPTAAGPWTSTSGSGCSQAGDFLGLAETLASFRVGAHSLSADNEASIYDDQRAIMDQVAATPQLRVRPMDRAVRCVSARPWDGCGDGCCSRCPPARAAAVVERGPAVSSCGS